MMSLIQVRTKRLLTKVDASLIAINVLFCREVNEEGTAEHDAMIDLGCDLEEIKEQIELSLEYDVPFTLEMISCLESKYSALAA